MAILQHTIKMAITIVVTAATTIHLVTTQATILQLDTIQATRIRLGIAATRTQLATTPIMELDTTQPLMEPDMFQATRTRQARTLVPTTRTPILIGQTITQPSMAIMCPLLPALMDITRALVTPITTEH